MNGPEIALAASAREWPERLHRFLLDHGGGRVRARVMGAVQALEEQYQVLFIDDVCSFLTPRLVRELRELGREVVGVFSPADGPDAKRHLLECGITDVVEEDASPDELLAVARATLTHREPHLVSAPRRSKGLRVGVVGVSGGVGCTEVAIALSASLTHLRPTLLLDLDQGGPALAQRLDLPLHPNLLTAVDLAHRAPRELAKAVHHRGELDVIGGLASATASVGRGEMDALLDEAARDGYEVLVADLGPAPLATLDTAGFSILVVVAAANPVGITRLVKAVETLPRHREAERVLAVLNRSGNGATRRIEIRAELTHLLPDVPVMLVPEDPRLDRAAWDGVPVSRGPFTKAVAGLAELLDGVVGP